MDIVLGLASVLVATTVTVASMLGVRRRAPEGGRLTDRDRASGAFGVLATGITVLLGVLILVAFQSYDASRAGAEAEGAAVAQQARTAQLLPGGSAEELIGELTCYARSVAGAEWGQGTPGDQVDQVDPWGARLFRTISQVHPRTVVERSAYDRWMSQTSDREQARIDRQRGAGGVVPLPLWLALVVLCGVLFGCLLFFADPVERALTQGMLMGSVTVLVSVLMLVLLFLDHPQGAGAGRLQPTAMERTVRMIGTQAQVAGITVDPPCDGPGRARF